MKRLKVVQIGLGHDHAPDVLESISCQQDLFEVVGFAVPESEQEKTKNLIKKFCDEKMIPYLTVEEALNYLSTMEGSPDPLSRWETCIPQCID